MDFLDEKEPLDDAGVISDEDGSAISLSCDGRLEISGTEGESEAKLSDGKSLTMRVTKVMIRCAFLEVHVEEEMFAQFGDEDDIEDVEDESFEQEGPLGNGLGEAEVEHKVEEEALVAFYGCLHLEFSLDDNPTLSPIWKRTGFLGPHQISLQH